MRENTNINIIPTRKKKKYSQSEAVLISHAKNNLSIEFAVKLLHVKCLYKIVNEEIKYNLFVVVNLLKVN